MPGRDVKWLPLELTVVVVVWVAASLWVLDRYAHVPQWARAGIVVVGALAVGVALGWWRVIRHGPGIAPSLPAEPDRQVERAGLISYRGRRRVARTSTSRRFAMGRLGWIERTRERRRLKRERMGDSPEKRSERHTPRGGAVDLMLKLGGVERRSRFKS